jgi:catechol 2,3-dioxygenase-like lactoylglutathione lyase family enzyme
MNLTFVRLLVDDFPACFRFYRDVMGFTPTIELNQPIAMREAA